MIRNPHSGLTKYLNCVRLQFQSMLNDFVMPKEIHNHNQICGEIYYPGNRIGVLLVHSLSGTPYRLEFLAKALERANFTVLAPCLSGHGTDPANLMETHYSRWLEEVGASIVRLKAICEKVYIIGDSLGGGLGMVASLSNPVAGIVAMSTPIFYRRHRIWNMVFKTAGRFMEYYVKKDSGYKSYEKVPVKIIKEAYEFTNSDVKNAISEINVPIMVIQGKKDRIVHPRSAQYIFNNIATDKKELIWVNDGEHSLTTGSGKEKVFEEIINFINRQVKNTNGKAY